jgi:hypothetical protein
MSGPVHGHAQRPFLTDAVEELGCVDAKDTIPFSSGFVGDASMTLESIFALTEDKRLALETLPMQVVANQYIVREGDCPRSRLILNVIAFV